MHDSSFYLMHLFVEGHLLQPRGQATRILDVGSADVNGTFRPLFDKPRWTYTGLDIVPGTNVDIVAEKPYCWPLEEDSFDVVISGSCLEHVQAPWLWAREVARVVRPGGLVMVIAPWRWPQHRHPVDCWRVLPDGMSFLLGGWAGLDVVECGIRECDTYCVARRPA